MPRSMLAAVHEATLETGDDPVRPEGETDAPASSATKETEMSTQPKPAGGSNTDAGIPQADHEAAVNAARAEGEASGAKTATDRLVTAMGADGVKGDASRMAAALDLAQKSPTMSGEEVAAFVVANVPATAGSANYEQERLGAAGLAQPGKPRNEASAGKAGWKTTAERINSRAN